MPPRLEPSDIIIDCVDADRLAAFWSALLERPAGARNGPYVALERVKEHDIGIGFQEVPEQKATKNRVHFDISSSPDIDIVATKAGIEELGGTRVSGYEAGGFLVMADPEGNEFCVVGAEQIQLDDEGRTHYLDGLDL